MQKIQKDKKGALGFELIISFAIVIAIAGSVLIFTSEMNEDIGSDLVENTTAYNASQDVGRANSTFAGKLPLLAKLGVFFIILMALMLIAKPWMR